MHCAQVEQLPDLLNSCKFQPAFLMTLCLIIDSVDSINRCPVLQSTQPTP